MVLDRKISIIAICFAAALYAATFKYPVEVIAFPRFLIWTLLGLSVLLFIRPGHTSGYSLKELLPKEKVIAALLLVVYIIVFPIVGYFVTTFIFAILYMWIFNRKDLKKYLLVAAVYCGIIYLLFQKWLFVWFPEGMLM